MMSGHERGTERGASDSRSVERIAETLREPVPVRGEWRAGLLRSIAMLPEPSATREPAPHGHWRMRPVTALAAGLMCVLVGASAATLMLQRGRHSAPPADALAVLTATEPLPGEIAGRSVVRFVFVAPYAAKVTLVGDFNGWNPSTMPMRRSADGRAWLLDVRLAPGRHVYSFVVDGDLAPDPAAPRAGDDDFGVPSSVVFVSGART
jgi:hypothetical protein